MRPAYSAGDRNAFGISDFTDGALIIAPPPAANAYDAYAAIRNRHAPINSAR